ncbi:unnamed protein product, partial [marine sediment metagenome]
NTKINTPLNTHIFIHTHAYIHTHARARACT